MEKVKRYILPGTDHIAAKVIQVGGNVLRSTSSLILFWNEEELQLHWKKSIFISVYKRVMKLTVVITEEPVSIAERSKGCTVYDRLNIEIAVSNPAQGMDVCLRVSVLCCPVFR
jgi:hypothetical protein